MKGRRLHLKHLYTLLGVVFGVIVIPLLLGMGVYSLWPEALYITTNNSKYWFYYLMGCVSILALLVVVAIIMQIGKPLLDYLWPKE
jgi:hypothetical protein